MLLPLSEKEAASLRAFLEANADCEAQAENEYVADLYDLEAPMTLDLVFVKGGVRVGRAPVCSPTTRRWKAITSASRSWRSRRCAAPLMEAGAFA